MIDIEDYNFEKGRMTCLKDCVFLGECLDDDYAEFEEEVDKKFGEDNDLPACRRFKITKKIKDENTDN